MQAPEKAAPGVLRERDEVLAAAARAIGDTATGRGSVVFIAGDAGLGKTSVLTHAARLAPASMEVTTASCEAMESTLPFGVVVQVLTSLGEHDLVQEITGSATPALEPSAPLYRISRWLEARQHTALLVLVDDLQWCDGDSLRVLAFAARRLSRLPVAIVATFRLWPPDADEVAESLVADGHAALHRLAPLSRTGAANVLGAVAGSDISAADTERAWELCRGNPLLLEQLALAIERGEGIPDAGENVTAVAESIVLSRFAGLDRTGLQCVRVASVLGPTFAPEVAAEVAGLDESLVDRTIQALCSSGLMVDNARGGLRFAHPLFAQALYEDLAPPVRERIHARCFEALHRRGLDAEAGAHAIRAHMAGNETAIAVLERGGRVALAAGAVASAVQQLGAAADLSGDRCAPALLLGLAEALSGVGRVDDAFAVLKRLLAASNLAWDERSEALRMQGRTMYLVGAVDHGEAAFREAVALAEAHDPVRAVQPLLDQSLSAWLAGGPALALPLAARARELAVNGDRELRERAEVTWGHIALDAGDPAGLTATTPLLRALLAGGDEGIDAEELAWPWATVPLMANNAMHAEHLDDAERALRHALNAAERAGTANTLATLDIYAANLAIRRGRLDDALALGRRAVEYAELTPGVGDYAALVEAEALLWSGHLAESEALCVTAEAAAETQWFARLWLTHVRGCRLLWEGNPTASDQFLVAEATCEAVGIGEPCLLHWGAHAAAAHALAGRPKDGERVVAWLDARGRDLACRYPRIAASVGRAHLAWAAGDAEAAIAASAAAVELHAGVDLPLLRAETLLSHGLFLRRLGRAVEARRPLADALAIAEATGAGWVATSATAELSIAGGRRRRPAAPVHGGLTSAEQRVADLAGEGLTNAEIASRLYLSVNTVETHLKRVFAKLSIKSRRELMRGHT